MGADAWTKLKTIDGLMNAFSCNSAKRKLKTKPTLLRHTLCVRLYNITDKEKKTKDQTHFVATHTLCAVV